MDAVPNSNVLYSLMFTYLHDSDEGLLNPKQSGSLNLMVDQILATDTANFKAYNLCKKGVCKDLDEFYKGADKQRDNDSKNNFGEVSPSTTTSVSSFDNGADYGEKTETDNKKRSTPIAVKKVWSCKALSYLICLAKFFFLVFVLTTCFDHVTQLNGISGCLHVQSVATHINGPITCPTMEQTLLTNRSRISKVTSSYLFQCDYEEYWGQLHIEHLDVHTLMVYPASLSVRDGASELYVRQGDSALVTMECFESQDYCEAGDEWLWNDNVTKILIDDKLVEEHTQIVPAQRIENHHMSNKTQISYGNFCLTELCISSSINCPLSMYEDTKCTIKLSTTYEWQALDIGSTLDSMSLNGSCINENWNVIAKDTCDTQFQTASKQSKANDIILGLDPQAYSNHLPISLSEIQNHGTPTKDWFKEFVSQPFEVNYSRIICAHHFIQGELSTNLSTNYSLLLCSESHPLLNQSYLVYYALTLATLLAFMTISSATFILAIVLTRISQTIRHIIVACYTACKNTIRNRKMEHNSTSKLPGSAKSNGSRLFQKAIICAMIFILLPPRCGIVTTHERQYAISPILNVSEVAGNEAMAELVAYNVSSSQNISKECQMSNIDRVLLPVSKCIDFHPALICIIMVMIAAYFVRKAMSRSVFYHVMSPIEAKSTDEILIPNICDEDQHRGLDQKKQRGSCTRRWIEIFTNFCQRPPRSRKRTEYTNKIRNLTHNSHSADGVAILDDSEGGNMFGLTEPRSPGEKDIHPTTVLSQSESDGKLSSSNNIDSKFEMENCSVQTCSQVLAPTSKVCKKNCKFKSTNGNAETERSCTTSRSINTDESHIEKEVEVSIIQLREDGDPLPVTSRAHRTEQTPISAVSVISRYWHNQIATSSELRFLDTCDFSDLGEFPQECDSIQNAAYTLVKCDCSPTQLFIVRFFQLKAGLYESLTVAFVDVHTHATYTHCLLWQSLVAVTNIANVTLSEDLIYILQVCIFAADSIQCQIGISQLSSVNNVVNIDDKNLTPPTNSDQNSYLFTLKIKEFSPSGYQDQDIKNVAFCLQSPQLAPAKARLKREAANLSIANTHAEIPAQSGPNLPASIDIKNRLWTIIHYISCEDIGIKVSHRPHTITDSDADIVNISPKISPMSLINQRLQIHLSTMESDFSKTSPLIPTQALQLQFGCLSTTTTGLCMCLVAETILQIPSLPTLQLHSAITRGVYPNYCSLPGEILCYCSTHDQPLTTATVSQMHIAISSLVPQEVTLSACYLSVARFHPSSPLHKKEQLLVNTIAVEPRIYDGSMAIKFHKRCEHEQIADSITTGTSALLHHHQMLRSSNCIALSSLHKKEQLVGEVTCTVESQIYDGSKRVKSCERAEGITTSILSAHHRLTLQPVNCVELFPLPKKEPLVIIATIELRSYNGSKRVNLHESELEEIAYGNTPNTSTHPHLTLDQIPYSWERAKVHVYPLILMHTRYCCLRKENLKLNIEHLMLTNKRRTAQSHNSRYFNTNGKVRLNKNSQLAVKNKGLPSCSPFNSSGATAIMVTCSQLHRKDATSCCTPSSQNLQSSVEDFSEFDTLKFVSIHNNSNDTILLNNTDKNRTVKRADGDNDDEGRCGTKMKSDNSGKEDGAGYSGDNDSESSGDINLHSTHRKVRKKKKKPPTKQWLSWCKSTAPPISLFRGISDKPQKESTPYPPASVYIVAGTSIHLRSQPCQVAQRCPEQTHKLSINCHCILQLLLQHCRTCACTRRARRLQEDADDLPEIHNVHVSVEESSHQHTSIVIAHGSVLSRPPSQALQVTISHPFSNQVIEGILSMLPSHVVHSGSNTLPSCPPSGAYDSGFGATCSSSISHGRRPQIVFQDDPHPHDSTLAIATRQRVLEHSNEPNWSNADGLNNDNTVSPHSISVLTY